MDIYNLTNLSDFNALVGVLSGFIRNYLSDEYSGYKPGWIDLKFIRVDYNNTKLKELDRYYFFESTPKFESKSTLKDQGCSSHLPRKELTYQDRVKAFASLLKLTPMYQSLLDLKHNDKMLRGFNYMGDRYEIHSNWKKEYEEYPKEREDKHREHILSMREI